MSLYEALKTTVQGLLGAKAQAGDLEAGDDSAKTPATGAVDPAAGTAALNEGMEGIRNHLRRVGGALGTLGTAVVGGLSYARLNDMFPVPPSIDTVVYVLAGIGLALSFGGLVYVGGRFFKAQRRILLTEVSDISGSEGPLKSRVAAAFPFAPLVPPPPSGPFVPKVVRKSLNNEERDIVKQIFDDFARGEEADSLQVLDRRKLRLSRIARGLDQTKDAALYKWVKSEADYLETYESNALVGAGAEVLESRAQEVFRSWKTTAGLLATAIGAALVWGVADYSKGQRDLISLQADCVKAEAAGAIGACDVLLDDERHTALRNTAHSAAARTQADKAKATADNANLPPDQRKSFDSRAICRTQLELAKAPQWVDASKADRDATVALCVKLVK